MILSNISEQRKLEERLRKLSVVIEQTPAVVMITDINGTIEYVNPAFEKVTGYTAEEVIGANPRILKSGLMPADLYPKMWQTISSGEVWKGELCNRKKNGELYWDFGTVSPVRNEQGVITNYIAVKEDITERKKNEEELERYRLHLESIVAERTAALRSEIERRKQTEEMLIEKEASLTEAQRIGKLGSWDWNIQTNEMNWSEETYHIFDSSPTESTPTYQDALDMVHPDDLPAVQSAIENTLSTGASLFIDHRVILKDGQQRVISLNALPKQDHAGNIIRLIGTVQDISERVRVEKELLEKERLTHELAIGQRIQLSMLPKACPAIEGWQFAAFYQAASMVGGDFYDFIALPNKKMGVVIADVVGKGVPAALMMSMSRAVIRAVVSSKVGAASALLRSNKILYDDYYTDDAFLTAFYACIDTKDGRVEFANAGHNRPLWYSSQRDEITEMSSKGIVLGVIPGASIEQAAIEMKPGDILVFYTDGLVEALNAQNQFYELPRLHEVFKAHARKSAQEVLDAIVHSWKDFMGRAAQFDDSTIVVVKRT